MIEYILDDGVELHPIATSSVFDSQVDYSVELKKRDSATAEWKQLSPEEKRFHGERIENYFKYKGVADFKSEESQRGKNAYLLKNEITAQVKEVTPFKLLKIEELHHASSMEELLENTENAEHIRELYRIRKRTSGNTKGSGISEKEAKRIKNCMRQGRELYLSGLSGSLMVKPLNLFYSLTAYAYAVIMLNNPLRYTLDGLPGSHGLNYIPDKIMSQFGGDIKQGTFSDLFASFPTFSVRDKQASIVQENEASIFSFFGTRCTASMGTLLSMIPEIREYFSLVTGRASRTFQLQISTIHDERGVKWEFLIGDGKTRPSATGIVNDFGSFERSERDGKTIVAVPIAEAHKIRATIYADIRGNLWYIENPFFPIVLPEMCIHFLLTNCFSNIMRYSPDNWGDILLNQVQSDISLITRKYLSAFENKFPVLLLRSLSKFYPFVSVEN